MQLTQKNITINIFLIAISCCLATILLEITLRILGYKPLDLNTKLSGEGYFWICDKNLGFRNRPNGIYRNENFRLKPIVTTDKNGFRNGFGWSYDSDFPIILFVGDSTIFCSEVNDENTGPSEVAKLLSGKFDLKVLNAGVRGYNTLQSLRMLEECLEYFPKIIVVVYVYCENDYYENLNPDLHYPAKAPIVRWDKENGKLGLIEVSNPRVPWGMDFVSYARDESEKITPRQRITNNIRSVSVLIHQLLISKNRFQDIIHGRRWIADANIARMNYADEALEELVRKMNQICNAKRIIFLSTCFTNGEPRYLPECKRFSAICERLGIQYLDITKRFIESPLNYMAQYFDGTYNPHYGPLGAKTFAEAVYSILKPILSDKVINDAKLSSKEAVRKVRKSTQENRGLLKRRGD